MDALARNWDWQTDKGMPIFIEPAAGGKRKMTAVRDHEGAAALVACGYRFPRVEARRWLAELEKVDDWLDQAPRQRPGQQ